MYHSKRTVCGETAGQISTNAERNALGGAFLARVFIKEEKATVDGCSRCTIVTRVRSSMPQKVGIEVSEPRSTSTALSLTPGSETIMSRAHGLRVICTLRIVTKNCHTL